jgi:PAS domain S-box-containing protein
MNQSALALDQIDESFEECRNHLRRVEPAAKEVPAGPQVAAVVEQKSRRSEEYYRNLVEGARDIILTVSTDGVITSLNPAFETITGRQRKDWIGKPLVSLLDSLDVNLCEQMLERVSRKETAPVFELNMKSSHGKNRTIEFAASPHIIDGRVEGLFGIVRDVTEERAAREEGNRLATVVKEVGDGIVITDCDGLIEYVNPAFEHTTGYESAEIIGRHYNILSNAPGNMEEDLCSDKATWESITGSSICVVQRTHKKKDGTLYEVRTTISPIRNTSGTIVNYALIERDITGVLKLEGQLRQAQKLEAIGTLSSSIAHDFNNILTPIMVYTEIAISNVEDGSLPDLNKLEEVLSAAQRAKSLVRQILTYSRRTEQEEIRPVKVRDIVEESVRLLRASLPDSIDIRQYIATDAKVSGNPTQIQQVVMNLCANASQAMLKNGGTLRLALGEVELDQNSMSRYPGLQPGSYIYLLVDDSGHGIEPGIMDKIFDPFFTTKGPREGTGLGLAIVHRIVKSHGGAITVRSELGKGSTFKILLPGIDDAQYQEKIEVKPTTGPVGVFAQGFNNNVTKGSS